MFWYIASSLCCLCFVCAFSFPFAFVDVVTDRSREPPLCTVTRGSPKASKQWLGNVRNATRAASSELWKGEGDAEGLPCRREGSDRALAAPERRWNDSWIGCTPCLHSERTSKGFCIDSAAAGAGKGGGDARRMHPHLGMKQAQPLGQRVDQARARCRRVVEAGEAGAGSAAEGPG